MGRGGIVDCGGGCAGPRVNTRVAETHSAIRAATEGGADRVASAAQHLALARRELAYAESLLAEDERREADGFLLRAQADAELALTLADEQPVREEAARAAARVAALRARENL